MKRRIKQTCNVNHAIWKGAISRFDWAWRWGLLGLLVALGLLGLETVKAQVTPFPPMTNLRTNDSRAIDTAVNTIMQALTVQGSPVAFDHLLSQTSSAQLLCDIQLSKTSYVTGDTVTASMLRIANPGTAPAPIELKLWFEIPTLPPVSYVNLGTKGDVVLPVGFDTNVGPLALFTVTPTFPRGTYGFNCRMLHPMTKDSLTEDLHPFTIQ